MKNVLLTYATEEFANNARALAESARAVGFDECLVMGPASIKGTQFYKDYEAILTQKRGAGYWLWKPYVILRVLERLSPDDALLYTDAGRTNYYKFSTFCARLFQNARSNNKGFLLGAEISHHGPISYWTKRDCFVFMGVKDESICTRSPIQATPSVWTPSAPAQAFLEAWLRYCCDARCLTDIPNTCGLPNLPGFQDHRHDQAILSILAHMRGAPRLDFSNTMVNRLINLRPLSGLGANFYKRPQNLDDLLGSDNPLLLVREFIRLRKAGR